MSVFLSHTTPKARKQYRCYLCGQPILAGEVHDKSSGIDDGLYSLRMHTECYASTAGWKSEDWEYVDLPIERPEKK